MPFFFVLFAASAAATQPRILNTLSSFRICRGSEGRAWGSITNISSFARSFRSYFFSIPLQLYSWLSWNNSTLSTILEESVFLKLFNFCDDTSNAVIPMKLKSKSRDEIKA
ncbi:hypothetical protein NPIL_568271 [Nephila pilipes]|uniref:Secreted protein n=1 Tax=Nephila pilipes TaxID=299642 RepID=A0A8X6ILT5_NEPPI|nr:hypothetical protein NPIL_568271 [Nephila pilipes]